MNEPKKMGIGQELARLRNTATWSIEGLRACWVDEKSFRQWTGLNLLSWVLLIGFGFSTAETVVLVALGVLVLIVELLNSAIEATVDYVSTDRHPLAKKAKDVASAAVMMSGLLWGAGWVLVLVGWLAG